MKNFTRGLIVTLFLLLLLQPTTLTNAAAASKSNSDSFVIEVGTKKMLHKGRAFTAEQPSVLLKGTTYATARALAAGMELQLSYNGKAGTYTLKNAETQVHFSINSNNYIINGSKFVRDNPYVEKGTLMLPVRPIVEFFNAQMKVSTNKNSKMIEIMLNVKPVAAFKVTPSEIYAQQTAVEYQDLATYAQGRAIVAERWEGKSVTFDQAGTYTVKRWVKDNTGQWSEPFAVQLEVKPPNQPPTAYFETDKHTYKMGEWIEYRDLSTDDENRIVHTEWLNREDGYFEPGQKEITLTVTDAHGEKSTYTQTIEITEELLYPKDLFDVVYRQQGDKYTFNGSEVREYPQVDYSTSSYTQTLIRSNSPEMIHEEGIYYKDIVQGKVRFLLHHQNKTNSSKRVFLVATNVNKNPVGVNIEHVGIGGPYTYVSTTGKQAVGRFLESHVAAKPPVKVIIPAGTSKIIIPELNKNQLNPGSVVTMYADIAVDSNIKIEVVIINANEDLDKRLPTLPLLNRDGKHVRGTFEDANRTLTVVQPVGLRKERMILTDKIVDTRLSGFDRTTGDVMSNDGNNGVLYTVELTNVNPYTAIVVNPRGGHYAGAFNVNGRVIYTTERSILKNPDEAAILYKTGEETESVTITFTPASGSNLPINFLFIPYQQH
ncbi:stalk domain-containing protein [Paenibacillus tarimensis]|uniref:stalk domain-containing protein n=1 Tax=Paenibacillus tarimensis TaxID=416012 RepID=UPI001F2AEC0E|nr:stalk domain-containing protein [Paenibacillus tarimensis]MCF2944921.1 copper amine oxidase N-terminal domain-containing protein [Paenibacillus tarimensis]